MATDFFQRQAEARRSTLWLVALFCMAVAAIVGTVMAVTAAAVSSQMKAPTQSYSAHPEQVVIPLLAGAIALAIIFCGSLYKVIDLRTGGGTRVAEGLGGKRIFPNTQDFVERRLLNVVEEMALASGTPVPPVFVLDEPGINAFAAGFSPSDAVLGITRGCAEQLTRDELQGVIAHEFSHILNGDMRMSIRLIGILYGILMIGMAGQFILRMFFFSGRSSRRSNGDKGGGQVILVIIALGLTAMILGFVGTFFGNLIKAAVSRQREFLADASAVQFTRNPGGIADALKRIGGAATGGKLKAANAAEASHMYFAQGVWEGFTGLWATHPPLPKRILAIEPNWDGKFLSSQSAAVSVGPAGSAGFASASEHPQPNIDQEVPVSVMDHAVEQVGAPTIEHRHYASDLLRGLPPELVENVHEPYGARAVIYGLLLDRDPEIRAGQWETLNKYATADVVHLLSQLQSSIDQLDVRARLPLVDLALPALRAMCNTQYREFRRCFVVLRKPTSASSCSNGCFRKSCCDT